MNKKKGGNTTPKYKPPIYQRMKKSNNKNELEKIINDNYIKEITFYPVDFSLRKDKNIKEIVDTYKKLYSKTTNKNKLKSLSYHYKNDNDFPEFISTRKKLNLNSNNFKDEYEKRIDKIDKFIKRRLQDYNKCYEKQPKYKKIFDKYKNFNTKLMNNSRNNRVRKFCKSAIPWNKCEKKNCNNVRDFKFL